MAQKTIVTHVSPDFDGIPAIWLLKKFHPDFANAKLAFVPAGQTLNGMPPDSDPNILHVDTGMGKFDHHQTRDFTCGAKLVYEWLVRENYIDSDDESLSRMMEVVTQLDHGWDNYKWSDAADDKYEFMLHNILVGWKVIYPGQDGKHIGLTIDALEAIYKIMQFKVRAEKELKAGKKFNTKWGEGVALATNNLSILDMGVKKGFAVVATKDPVRGNVRITGSNVKNVDLTKAYEILLERDPQASWFLHSSKVLLRNGSVRNPQMKATKLSIEEVAEVLEKV